MSYHRPSVLLVGNFLSVATRTRSVCEDLANRFRLSGWTVFSTSTRLGRFARLADMLTTTWKHRHQYDVAMVEVYSGPAFLWAEAVCSLLSMLNKPYLLTLQGGNLPNFGRRWPRRISRLLNSAEFVTTPSRYLLEAMHPYRPDLILLPNSIDLEKYAFHPRQEPEPKLVWLRAFHAIYNPSLAPRALAYLLPDFPVACLTMIGSDKGDGSLQKTKKIANDLSIANRIDFPGGVLKADVPKWLSKGDIFINTTNYDNTPVSVIEAMACGLCVVSTNVGGLPYLLDHEKDALLIPADDPKSMASAIHRILTEPGLANQLSQNARKKAEKFDRSIILHQWLELFREVANLERTYERF